MAIIASTVRARFHCPVRISSGTFRAEQEWDLPRAEAGVPTPERQSGEVAVFIRLYEGLNRSAGEDSILTDAQTSATGCT